MVDDQVKYRLQNCSTGRLLSVLKEKDLKELHHFLPHARMSLMQGVFFTLKREKATRTYFSQFSFNAQRSRRERQRPELSKFSSKGGLVPILWETFIS